MNIVFSILNLNVLINLIIVILRQFPCFDNSCFSEHFLFIFSWTMLKQCSQERILKQKTSNCCEAASTYSVLF